MKHDRQNRPSSPEASEYHIVRPEQYLYSDAEYRSAPREGGPVYGYNPSRYYDADGNRDCHRGQLGLKTILVLCLVCMIVSGILGMGGLYLLARNRQPAAAEDSGLAAFYADADPQEQQQGPLTLTAIPAGAVPMAGEEPYAMACGQVVAVTATAPQGGSLSGSGIVVSADGYILTNYHVIQAGALNGWPITAVTFSGDRYDAQLIGTEAESDLAVLKVEAQGLSAAVLGDSDALSVGQRVYAVGNPLGELNFSMTRGVISAQDRLITAGENTLANMFQFDAAVNSGNSGGPVYNTYGQVVGIVTAKYSSSGVEGLGFAIPSTDAYAIANELINKGYVSGKAYLGLTLRSVTPSAARYFDMPMGAYISAVEAGSNADQAGLRPGDIVTAVDGKSISNADEMVALTRAYKAGDTAALTVSRSGEDITVTVTFGSAG